MSHNHDTIDPHEILASEEHGHEHVHVTNFWTMFWVFAVLLVLTALTVWTSNLHDIVIGNSIVEIGSTPHIIIAMVIAIVKAVLVGAYFMHLKYDKPINTIIVAATLFGVALFIGLTIMDFQARGIGERLERGEIYDGGNMALFAGDKQKLIDKGAAAEGGVEGSIVGQSKASGEAVPHAEEHSDENADDHSEDSSTDH